MEEKNFIGIFFKLRFYSFSPSKMSIKLNCTAIENDWWKIAILSVCFSNQKINLIWISSRWFLYVVNFIFCRLNFCVERPQHSVVFDKLKNGCLAIHCWAVPSSKQLNIVLLWVVNVKEKCEIIRKFYIFLLLFQFIKCMGVCEHVHKKNMLNCLRFSCVLSFYLEAICNCIKVVWVLYKPKRGMEW